MAGYVNLASKYAKKVDERFNRESQAMLALNSDYKFTGVRTVNVYSIPTAPMNDYTRSGSSRYGTPADLTRNVQTLTVNNDRAFTFIIDQGDKIQSEMVSDAGKALGREQKEVYVPEFDAYVFRKLAEEATARGNSVDTPVTKENAYEVFLAGMEHLGDCNVPDKGRVAFCSYKFANFLKQDPAFMKQGDKSQGMVERGVIGEVDGCKIVKVPSSRLPAGCAFLLTHPIAATGVKQLEDYKIHDNPPGINGWLVEGRVIYDCFVLDEKADAIYYHGGQTAMRRLNVTVSDNGDGNIGILVNPGKPEKGNEFRYKLGATATAVTYDENLTSWTKLPKSGTAVAASSNKYVTVAEITTAGTLARAVGSARISRNS